MAMHEPNSWIVGSEPNSQVARRLCGQKRHVSARWIVEVKGFRSRIDVVCLVALCENNKVMTVEVNWMRCRRELLIRIIEEILASDDKVDVAMAVVLVYNGVLWIECLVVEIQDGGIREIDPKKR